jgi:hypothetical protein
MSLEKFFDFFDSDMLQLLDVERVLIDQMIPFDRDALWTHVPPGR